jgi:hypothetical protein
MADLGTAINYVQVALWLYGSFVWVRKMVRDKKFELDPFGHIGNRLIGYAIAAGLLISSASLYYNYRPRTVTQTTYVQQPLPPAIIQGWGDTSGKNCTVQINPGAVYRYKDTDEIAVACGFVNSGVDKFEDDTITITPLYTIGLQPFALSAPWSKSMAALLEKAGREVKIAEHNQCASAEIPTWYELILLPKGTQISDIHKLSDIPRFGGLILSQQAAL